MPAKQEVATPHVESQSQPAAPSLTMERAAAAESAPTVPATHTMPTPVQPTAHDIKLQVGGDGDQRVEVRVTERGGDVHVAVRTPDARLAGDLRQDLPALANRLAQSGFHTATWQPAADSERQRLAYAEAGASGQDAQSQSRQNGREQQRDPQEQKPKGPDNPARPSQKNEPGKDFAWLLSSIR